MTDAVRPPPSLAGRRVAVTGASGFIGRAVVRALTSAGAEVTALVRGRHGADESRRLGVRPVVAPLRPGPELEAALTGCEALVHLAYDVRADAADNLAAFDAVVGAAERSGVARVVHASSIVAYDDWPSGGPTGRIDEESSCDRVPATGYRWAKLAMEARLLDGSLPAAILQPTIVYGPGSEIWTEAPLLALRTGGLVLPEPCGRAPLVHVDDVARAVILALGLPDLGRERFIVTGPSAPGWDELFAGYAAMTRGGRLIRVPREAFDPPEPAPGSGAASSGGPSLAARASALLRRRLGRDRVAALRTFAAHLQGLRGPRQPSPWDVALYVSSPRIESRHAAERLGYRPEVDLDRGLMTLRQHSGKGLSRSTDAAPQ